MDNPSINLPKQMQKNISQQFDNKSSQHPFWNQTKDYATSFYKSVINYLECDQVYSSNQVVNELEESKKKYKDDYSLSYSQRLPYFAYSFQQAVKLHQIEQQRAEKGYCQELIRLICCLGGTNVQSLGEDYRDQKLLQKQQSYKNTPLARDSNHTVKNSAKACQIYLAGTYVGGKQSKRYSKDNLQEMKRMGQQNYRKRKPIMKKQTIEQDDILFKDDDELRNSTTTIKIKVEGSKEKKEKGQMKKEYRSSKKQDDVKQLSLHFEEFQDEDGADFNAIVYKDISEKYSTKTRRKKIQNIADKNEQNARPSIQSQGQLRESSQEKYTNDNINNGFKKDVQSNINNNQKQHFEKQQKSMKKIMKKRKVKRKDEINKQQIILQDNINKQTNTVIINTKQKDSGLKTMPLKINKHRYNKSIDADIEQLNIVVQNQIQNQDNIITNKAKTQLLKNNQKISKKQKVMHIHHNQQDQIQIDVQLNLDNNQPTLDNLNSVPKSIKKKIQNTQIYSQSMGIDSMENMKGIDNQSKTVGVSGSVEDPLAIRKRKKAKKPIVETEQNEQFQMLDID